MRLESFDVYSLRKASSYSCSAENEETVTKEQAQERLYDLRSERDYLETLENSLNNRIEMLWEEARKLLSEHSGLILQRRPGVTGRLKLREKTWWIRWPEWLCNLLTKHALTMKWVRYDLDMSGKSCRCGWYDKRDC